MTDGKDPDWAYSIAELAKSFSGVVSARTLEAITSYDGFPIEVLGPSSYRYHKTRAALWLSANPMAFKRDFLKSYRQPKYQKIGTTKSEKDIDGDYEEARYKQLRADKMELKLEEDRGKLCKTDFRDEDEIARNIIIRNVIEEVCIADAGNYLSKSSMAEMVDVSKATSAKILTTIQERLKATNMEIEAMAPPLETHETKPDVLDGDDDFEQLNSMDILK
jgi:hypothetical protein